MSKKPRILVTKVLPQDCESRLDADFDAVRLGDDPHTIEAVTAAAATCGGILVTGSTPLNAGAIAALPPSVKIAATMSVGFDHIDIQAARAHGLIVTNTPDVLTDATADVTMLLLLGAARRATESMALIRENRWAGWSPTMLLGHDIGVRRMGILGLGRIGAAVAHRARAFGMAIHYHNRRPAPPERAAGATYHETLDSLLAVSDVLVLNAASTPETRGMIDDAAIAKLPKGAILVNSARGDLVNDDALIDALNNGHLFAAGLDVFKGEPRIDPRYRDLPNVFALPHIGSATVETRTAMGMLALDNLAAVLGPAGKPITPVT